VDDAHEAPGVAFFEGGTHGFGEGDHLAVGSHDGDDGVDAIAELADGGAGGGEVLLEEGAEACAEFGDGVEGGAGLDHDLDEGGGLGLFGGDHEGAAEGPFEALAAHDAGGGVEVGGVDEHELNADGGRGAVAGCGGGGGEGLFGAGFGVGGDVEGVKTDVELEHIGHFAGGFLGAFESGVDSVGGEVEPLSGFVVELAESVGVGVHDGVVDEVSQADAVDDLVVLCGSGGGPLVVFDGDDEGVGELPALGEHGADVGVLDLEGGELGFDELAVVALGLREDGGVVASHGAEESHDADVLEEAGDEDLIAVLGAGGFDEAFAADGGEEAAAPVVLVVEAVVLAGVDGGDEGEAQDEGFDGGEAEHDEGFVDGAAALAEAVEGRVDGAEDLDGEALVVLDGLGEFGEADVLVGAELDDLEGHRGQRRERRARQDLFQHLAVHRPSLSGPVERGVRREPQRSNCPRLSESIGRLGVPLQPDRAARGRELAAKT
jgi:hypothetical protein